MIFRSICFFFDYFTHFIIENIFFFFKLQLEIIDACVSYIETLQSQLDLVKPSNQNDESEDEEVDMLNNNMENNCKKSHL